ncbi:hypothetical protein [Lapidilactobacillus wuchangensis]|uniref:hypothetical protein n=1 Tax=Lapidilactobacillus wuchangensis TaxID=2486001 RepID=UPI000F7B834D|nr:hypothetical protein [Lapidilactobacillus wuchangensis]
MPLVFGILIGLMFIIGGIVELFLAGNFGRWLTKKGTAATSPFSLASLGSGTLIAILLIIMGIGGIFITLGGSIDLSQLKIIR